MTSKLSPLLLYVFIIAPCAQAKSQWHDFSVSLLRGTAYAVDYSLTSDDSTRDVVTLEYAAGYVWGDLFTFIDRLSSDRYQELYWELQPRLSLGYLLDRSIAIGPVEDVFMATTLEVANFDDPDGLSASSGSFTNTLIGIGASWRAPGFSYLHSNLYRAWNEAEADDYQLTLAWGLPFVLGRQAFLYDGFVDWSSSGADHHGSLNWTSQLKHDLGALWGSPGVLFWGVEYVFWRNKFGIPDRISGIRSDEHNLNLLVKWHL